MELRHLRYFVALTERLSFTEAARQVHVTQSTLSHQIKQLEDELGASLFDRTERKVSMTPAGELFLPHALECLAAIDSGITTLTSTAVEFTGHLRVAATPTFNINVVPRAIAEFRHLHPSVRITLEEFTSEEIVDKTKAGQVDLSIAYRPINLDDLRFDPLCNEELVLVLRADHPLAGRKRVRMAELHRRELILPMERYATRQLLEESFRSAGARPYVTIESGTIASLLRLVQHSGMATILSKYAVSSESGLHTVSLESPCPMRTPGLIWSRVKERSALEVSFAALLRTITETILIDQAS